MATRSTRTKTPAIEAPQNRDAANDWLHEMGTITRSIEQMRLNADKKKAAIDAQLKEATAPFIARRDHLFNGIFAFATANRQQLTDDGRVKTVKLPAGELSWRFTPLSVALTGVEDVIVRIKQLGLKDLFITTKESVNKESMLSAANRDKANSIEGVTIGQTEEFAVKPNATDPEVVDVRRRAKQLKIPVE